MKFGHLRTTLLGLALAAITTALGACGGGGNDNPEPPVLTTSGGNTTTGDGGGGGTGGGGTGGAPPGCDGPEGCFDCPPKTNDQHLNACTDTQCFKFDNKARLPLFNDGKLPPVP